MVAFLHSLLTKGKKRASAPTPDPNPNAVRSPMLWPEAGLSKPLCLVGLLGRALGHCSFSLIGLKRILFTNIFQRLKSPT